LRAAVDASFHCLTVDGDTSTNDMALVMANGASGVEPTEHELTTALTEVCVDLAKQVARDGEGATKLLEVRVTGSDDPRAAALAIANSPLVKTAMFGCDPNWGRIVAAAGRAGVSFDVDRATVQVGGVRLFENGLPYDHAAPQAAAHMQGREVSIDVNLGTGGGMEATIWTCDLSAEYVRINGEYRT
jgi:glutamate N-acetyltransferase/amino-acid N-acetyltransferase